MTNDLPILTLIFSAMLIMLVALLIHSEKVRSEADEFCAAKGMIAVYDFQKSSYICIHGIPTP